MKIATQTTKKSPEAITAKRRKMSILAWLLTAAMILNNLNLQFCDEVRIGLSPIDTAFVLFLLGLILGGWWIVNFVNTIYDIEHEDKYTDTGTKTIPKSKL